MRKEKETTSKTKADKFLELSLAIADLYVRKNSDYGDSFGISVQKYGLISALTRISDKFNRLESLILNKNRLVEDEKLTDTLLDLASYCIMTCIELQEKEKENKMNKNTPISPSTMVGRGGVFRQ